MPLDFSRARPLLHNCELGKLFIEELGWEPSRQKLTLRVGDQDHALAAIAEKHGFTAWLCQSPDGHLPDRAIRLKLDRALAETSFEHLIVFTDNNRSRQSWMWVRREPGRPLSGRTHEYTRGQPGDSLLQKLQLLFVSLEEEEAGLSVMEVSGRVRAAFDVERVTKRFYKDFDAHRKAFLKFIEGISELADREWYASVMLNRLMFVYFIQRKGFLDGDHNYLRSRLDRCQQEKGRDKFHSFYRYFLLRLFHEGLGGQKRTADLEKLLGRIPYLNGGMFEKHPIEERYDQIQIPDRAFERIFDYFDQYQWHLDERPLRADNEINPDVLGYIFEKYINQKQMGAYYTKEDITEYISKNTVLPFFLDAARTKCKVAFENPAGPTVWDLLVADPDRYIYPAVRHGTDQPLPPEISKGLDTTKPALIERRKGWNKPAPGEYALPTEIWREVVARRQRYEEVRAKLATGEVKEVNDLITLNLDIRQFAQDVVERCEGPDLLRACWNATERVTILDPTCGSGAFLFAALNILEPLYEACLDRMEAFLEDEAARLDRAGLKHTQNGYPLLPHKKFEDFALLLERVAAHPNRRYFIFKSIILNNLFGVDLMEEAVEICKLRLFLKLAAQVEPNTQHENLGIEPLPDIDFNIRAGNTLVGFATYDEVKGAVTAKFDFDNAMETISVKAADLQQTFDAFRQRQIEGDGSVPTDHKVELRKRLKALEDELNRYLAVEYGVKVKDKAAYAKWVKSHQPFHWFVEFYGIMEGGGFDVIIGNPPYVDYSKVRDTYRVLEPNYSTLECGNLYALVTERTLHLIEGRYGFILPLSSTNANGNSPLQELLRRSPCLHISHYAVRPSKLFNGVDMNLTIVLGAQRGANSHNTTPFNRWPSAFREYLFSTLQYATHDISVKKCAFPKFGNHVGPSVWKKLNAVKARINIYTAERPSRSLAFHGFGRYWRKCILEKLSDNYQEVSVASRFAPFVICLLNSQVAYWYWITLSDCYRFTKTDALNLTVPSGAEDREFKRLSEELLESYEANSVVQQKVARNMEVTSEKQFFPALSKDIIDEIDHILAQHYGFTEEELDFIINYDIKYRMGRDTGEEEP